MEQPPPQRRPPHWRDNRGFALRDRRLLQTPLKGLQLGAKSSAALETFLHRPLDPPSDNAKRCAIDFMQA
jgi:hypothetical protein